MAPPNGPANNGNGKNGNGAKIYEFPGPSSPKPTKIESPQPPVPSEPPEPPIRRPGFHFFTDFSELQAIFAGTSPKQSSGPFAKIQIYLEILANPMANGGYQARFGRQDQLYELSQEKPGDPIRVRYFQEGSSKKGTQGTEKPRFQITYYPDGRVGHALRFDQEGKPLKEKLFKEDKLVRAALDDHSTTLEFLRSRSEQLGDALKAFKRMEVPLQQLRPSELDLARRASWFRNYVVSEGKVYSLLTQNIGFAALGQYPSQNIITVFEDRGQNNVELFRISETGEINYAGEGKPRRLPGTIQLNLIDRLSTQLEKALKDPKAYQKKLHSALEGLEEAQSVKVKKPSVARTPFQQNPNSLTRGPFEEPIHTITNGRELLRWVRPFAPQTEIWQNPESPGDNRYLRAKGKIRWAMTKELFRWVGSAIWHGAINDWRNLKPQAGKIKLHLLPDGSADLEIYRNYTRHLPDGTLRKERGIFNILRRTADGKNIDLGNIVKQIAKERPDILELSRVEQIKLASHTLTHDSDVPRSLEIQTVESIPIDRLRVGDSGPKTVQEAWEALHQLDAVRGLKARIHQPMEAQVEINFPGSQPPTEMLIQQESHTTGKRMVVHLWQGDNVSTAVYDDGKFNQHESVRLNVAEVERARQGFHRPPWYHIPARGFARMRGYVEVNGLTYGVGYLASLPAAWGWERAFWTEGQRQAIGTPIPEMNLSALAYEVGAASTMLGFAGGSAWVNDAIFNYGGGLWSVWKDWQKPGITWKEAYRYHKPTFFNSGWARFKPLPKQALYLRAFAQRAVPLFFGLLTVEAYHKFGENWNLANVKNIDWNHMGTVFGRIGALSAGSAGFWAFASRRTQLAVARTATGQAARGLGGFLLRNKLLAHTPTQVGGARFAMTLKANLWTVAAEMAALRIWDSIDRKNQLIDRGKELRTDLSRSLDRYNRVISRLEYGEEITPKKILEAESGVQLAYQQYRSYLNMMEKENPTGRSSPLSLENDFGETYAEMAMESWLLGEKQAKSQWSHREKLYQLRSQEERAEKRLMDLYRSHGIPVPDSGPQESLRDFMARTTKIIHDNPEVLDKALATHKPIQAPVTLDSLDGKAIIDHFNRKIEQDPKFLNLELRLQARYLLNTFSGYRVKLPTGDTRPWTEAEAMAFLNDLFAENQRRQQQLRTPLLQMPEKSVPSPETLEKIAEAEVEIWAEASQNNRYLGKLRKEIADNVSGLDFQMKEYLKRAAAKRDRALLQFLPEEALTSPPPSKVAEVL